MAESFRKHKNELRTRYYDKYDNDEDRLKNCPPTINHEDWDMFLKNEATLSAKERRDKGKKKQIILQLWSSYWTYKSRRCRT